MKLNPFNKKAQFRARLLDELFDPEKVKAELDDIKAAHVARPVKIQLATISASAVSIFATGYGLMQKSVEVGLSGSIALGVALAASLAAGTVLTTATLQLFNIAVDAGKAQRKAVICLTGFVILPITCISSNYAIIGTSGPASTVYNMVDTADELKHYYHASVADVSSARSLRDIVRPSKESICQKAKAEALSGRYSGSAGYGAYAATLDGGCIEATAIVDTLQDTIDRNETRDEQALQAIEKLASIPKDESLGDVFARKYAFITQQNTLIHMIEEAKKEHVSKRLEAQLDNMKSAISSSGIQTGVFGRVQQAGIEDFRQSIGVIVKGVEAYIAATKDASGEHVTPPAKLLDMQEAIFAYWKKNIPQILLALMLDLMPIWFCAMLMVSRDIHRVRADEWLADDPENTPLIHDNNEER